jgi:osmoprotectant transport system ATP-binding protein
MTTPAFQLLGVSKRYGSAVALAATDLRIAAGRTTVLIGQSGSGKSTLLRLLLGLVRPDSGHVLFQGVEVAPENVVSLRRRMGYAIQGGGLFPHLTSAANICLMARYLRWPQSQVDARVRELVQLTRFPESGLSRFPSELSGGQAQRVSLMRALMLGPDVILLDEPLGALDPVTRFDLQAELRSIFETVRKTVVLVTHDIGEAAYFGHWLVLFRDGHIVQQGTMEDLMKRPSDPFVNRFITSQRTPSDELAPRS